MVEQETAPRLALSLNETADRLGVSRETVKREIARGNLPAKRVGLRRLMVPVDSLANYLHGTQEGK